MNLIFGIGFFLGTPILIMVIASIAGEFSRLNHKISSLQSENTKIYYLLSKNEQEELEEGLIALPSGSLSLAEDLQPSMEVILLKRENEKLKKLNGSLEGQVNKYKKESQDYYNRWVNEASKEPPLQETLFQLRKEVKKLDQIVQQRKRR